MRIIRGNDWKKKKQTIPNEFDSVFITMQCYLANDLNSILYKAVNSIQLFLVAHSIE